MSRVGTKSLSQNYSINIRKIAETVWASVKTNVLP